LKDLLLISPTFRKTIAQDRRDSSRPVAPLRPADDAVVIDSTGLSVGQVVDRVLELVVSRV
jgi:cytidylate kinase